MGVAVIQPPDFRRSLGLSIALHALVLGLFVLAWSLGSLLRTQTPEPLYVELEPLPQQKTKTRNRIVQTERSEESRTRPKEAFLGERNQTVDRETVGPTHEIKMGEQARVARAKAKSQEKAAKSLTRGPLSGLGLALLPPPGATHPAKPEPEWATPGVRPEDDVPNVAAGERTALNTQEFVYFGYYQRIRERLDRAWVPILREKVMGMYRRGRMLASDREHTTRIMVHLNAQGEITRVELRDESGTQELDDAAIKAFNQAGPFPNPPRGMVDRSGEIRIPWDFILRT